MSSYRVHVAHSALLTAFDDAWSAADLRALLTAADYEDAPAVEDGDLEEMCLLALQDLGPVAAAEGVLTPRLGTRLRRGQIAQLAQDMAEERQWEHHADMSLHEPLFHVGALLWRAFGSGFPKPDAVQLDLDVEPVDAAARADLDTGLDEVLLVRLIADGLPRQSLLYRLFGEQLERGAFHEATSIIWVWSTAPQPAGLRVRVIGSNAWIGPLRRVAPWTSDAETAGAAAGPRG